MRHLRAMKNADEVALPCRIGRPTQPSPRSDAEASAPRAPDQRAEDAPARVFGGIEGGEDVWPQGGAGGGAAAVCAVAAAWWRREGSSALLQLI